MKHVLIAAILFVATVTGFAATPTPPSIEHKMWFELHPDSQTLIGVDTIHIIKGSHTFLLAKKCDPSIVVLESDKMVDLKFVPARNIIHPENDDEAGWYDKAVAVTISGDKKVVVSWRGIFNDSVSSTMFSREQISGVPDGVASNAGIYLSNSALYYPTVVDEVQSFSVTLDAPAGWIPVTTGLRTKIGNAPDNFTRWSFGGWWQLDAVTIAAGKFVVREADTLGIHIETCFTPASDTLAPTYLAYAKRYIGRYSNEFGTYCWPSFSMVEAFFPAGYGLPGFTFLGSEVIALPFIPMTSLGHEVLHNWWGNGVYVQSNGGNWCEGLTVFGADWAYKADRGEDADYRRGLIKDFSSYVHDGRDFPLEKFTSRSSGATRAVGYGKSAFFFHTLKTMMGEDKFKVGLQKYFGQYKYRLAGWKEIEECMEQASGMDLKDTFHEWIQGTGAPKLKRVSVRQKESTLSIDLDIVGKPVPTWIPVRLSNGDKTRDIEMKVNGSHAAWTSLTESTIYDWRPTDVAIDPDCKVWREPAKGEIPPALSDLYGAKVVACYLISTKDAALDSAMRNMTKALFDSVVWVNSEKERPELPLAVFLSLAASPPQYLKAFQGLVKGPVQEKLVNYSNVMVSDYEGRIISSFAAENLAGVAALARKAPHYGKYSYLLFDEKGMNVAKGTLPPEKHELKVKVG